MKISIIGASGTTGQEIVRQIISSQILREVDAIQLVESNPASTHPFFLEGMMEDLLDAYEEVAPTLEVVNGLDKINGDMVIIASGKATPTEPKLATPCLRGDLAKDNLSIFQAIGQQLAQYPVDRPPIVLIVTNPVELGVHVIAQ